MADSLASDWSLASQADEESEVTVATVKETETGKDGLLLTSEFGVKARCFLWDATISCEFATKEKVLWFCRNYAKKWAFQQEKGKGGFLHWQVRVSLKKKVRAVQFCKGHWSPSSKNAFDQNTFDYVMKMDTRVAGPWTDKDDAEEEVFVDPYFTAAGGYTLRPWMMNVMDLLALSNADKHRSRRDIHVIVDTEGNAGKSTFARYLEINEGYHAVNPLSDTPEKITRQVYAIVAAARKKDPNQRLRFIFDLPRALGNDAFTKICTAIEMTKDGKAYEDRYHNKRIFFAPPEIIILCNRIPDQRVFSKDRWCVYDIAEMSVEGVLVDQGPVVEEVVAGTPPPPPPVLEDMVVELPAPTSEELAEVAAATLAALGDAGTTQETEDSQNGQCEATYSPELAPRRQAVTPIKSLRKRTATAAGLFESDRAPFTSVYSLVGGGITSEELEVMYPLKPEWLTTGSDSWYSYQDLRRRVAKYNFEAADLASNLEFLENDSEVHAYPAHFKDSLGEVKAALDSTTKLCIRAQMELDTIVKQNRYKKAKITYVPPDDDDDDDEFERVVWLHNRSHDDMAAFARRDALLSKK